jgi:hypothetical protein
VRIGSLLIVALVAATGVAGAQEQRGSLTGTVKDTSGSEVKGATVEARSPSLVGVAATVTDDQGAYRFPALPPGIYDVTASLTGFNPAHTPQVRLALGQLLKVDLVLTVAGVSESVQVRTESPLIDVRQNAAGITVARELIERVPQGRDFTTLVTSAPGITNEPRSFGIQIDGASGADNRFVIDGADTTSLTFGTSGKALVPDFVDEVQAKASGYNAEYRAAIGGVISAITRSGGNTWHGGGALYFTSDNLQGDVRPVLRLNPANQTLADYVTSPPDDFISPEPIFDLGGPVRRDRVWFFVGYDRPWTRTRRTVIFRDNGQRATFESRPVVQTVNANITAQLAKALRGRFALSNQRTHGGALLPNIQPDGTSTSNSALFPSQTRTDQFNDSYSLALDWFANARTYVNLTASYFTYGSHDEGTFSDTLQHFFAGSNFQFPEIPASLQHVNGYTDAPSSYRLVQDDENRFTVGVDATRYLSWRGQHSMKAGMLVERVANGVNQGAQAPTVQLFWDATLATNDGRRVRGTYGYYSVTRNIVTEGDVHANNVGLFIQDSWTMNDRLTLNFGVRTEREDVPSYRPENPGLQFGFFDKIAPRAGAAYDLRGDGRWRLYGSWGVFHDLMKLEIGRVMFGADHWVDYRFTLDTYDWPAIQCAHPPAAGPACPGAFIEQFDYRPVSNDPAHSLIDPDLEPSRSQELTLGVDHALSTTMSLGVRYAHKWIDRAIEAVGYIVPGGEEYWVTNPGFGRGEFPFGRSFPKQPRAERVYDGVEVRLRKRLADRWSLDTSYLWSRLRGNWSGIATSDEAVNMLQPNSGRIFDLLYYSYDVHGQTTLGPLGTDRPHQFKLQATYDFPWGTMVGANYLLESGIPKSTLMAQKGINFYPYGRGDLGRTPAYSQLDALLQHQFRLARGTKLTLGVNAINVFDQETVIRYATSPYRDQFNLADTVFFGGFDPVAVATAQRFRPDARFGLASGYQTRRSVRLQAKFAF